MLVALFKNIPFAIHVILKRKLYLYFVPAIIISLGFYLLFSGGRSLGSSVSFMENWWGIGWILKQSKVFFSFLMFLFFEFLILVMLSPINAYFAEQTKEEVTNQPVVFNLGVFLRSLKRMVVILIFAFSMQLLITLILWVLSFAFGDYFYEFASLINIAFFIGFSFFDFGLELDEINRKKSWEFAKANWLTCVLIGLIFNIGIYYPQKHGWLMIYFIAIVVLPHFLTILATAVYYKNKRT